MSEREIIIKNMSQLKKEIYGPNTLNEQERQVKLSLLNKYEIILSLINKEGQIPVSKRQEILEKRKELEKIDLKCTDESTVNIQGIHSLLEDFQGQYHDIIALYKGYSDKYKLEFLVYTKENSKGLIATPVININGHLTTFSPKKLTSNPKLMREITASFQKQFQNEIQSFNNVTSIPSIIGYLDDKQNMYVINNSSQTNKKQGEVSENLDKKDNSTTVENKPNNINENEQDKVEMNEPKNIPPITPITNNENMSSQTIPLSKSPITLSKKTQNIYYYKTKLPWYSKTENCTRNIFQYLKEKPTLCANVDCLYNNETSEIIISFSIPIEQLEFNEKYWSKGKDEWLTFLAQNFEQVDKDYLNNKYNPSLSIDDLKSRERLMFLTDLTLSNPSANIQEVSEQEKYRITSEIPLSELTTENTWPFIIDKDGYIIKITQKLSKYSFDFLKKGPDGINHIDDSQTNIDDDPFFIKTEIFNYIDKHIVKKDQDTIISSKSDNTNDSSNPIQDETIQALLEQNRLLLEQNKMLAEQIQLMQNMIMGQNKQDISNSK